MSTKHFHISEKYSRYVSQAYFDEELAEFDHSYLCGANYDDFQIITCLDPSCIWWV